MSTPCFRAKACRATASATVFAMVAPVVNTPLPHGNRCLIVAVPDPALRPVPAGQVSASTPEAYAEPRGKAHNPGARASRRGGMNGCAAQVRGPYRGDPTRDAPGDRAGEAHRPAHP